MEVIAKCAFGITIDHLGEENDPFMKKAREVFSPRINKSPIILLPCELITRIQYILVYTISHCDWM